MKIKINKEVIKNLKPCKDRYENYLTHYSEFSGGIEEFLDLPEISHEDKLWVALRLVPRMLVETFALDCAVSAAAAYADADAYAAAAYAAAYAAAAYAADAYAAAAAYAAAYAAYAAAADAARKKEQQTQIEALIYLIQSHEK